MPGVKEVQVERDKEVRIGIRVINERISAPLRLFGSIILHQ